MFYLYPNPTSSSIPSNHFSPYPLTPLPLSPLTPYPLIPLTPHTPKPPYPYTPIPVVVHTLLGYSPQTDPTGPLVGQGLAYAGFAAVLWPSIPLVVEQRLIGLGYGVVTSVQNGGLAAFPLIISGIATTKVFTSITLYLPTPIPPYPYTSS